MDKQLQRKELSKCWIQRKATTAISEVNKFKIVLQVCTDIFVVIKKLRRTCRFSL